MINPILQSLSQRNNMIMPLLNAGNPDQMYRYLMQNNPQFAQFVNQNKGKTPQQIAESYGINPAVLNNIMK